MESAEEKGASTNWRNILYFALLPALIAGLFAIGPRLYDEITKPRASIGYSITSGPALATPNATSKIYSVALINDGRLKLHNVEIVVSYSNGDIKAAAAQRSLGLGADYKVLRRSASISIPSMFKDDRMIISFLVDGSDRSLKPMVNVRSDETIGHESQITSNREPDSNDSLLTYLSTALAAVAAFLAYFSAILSKRTRERRHPDRRDIIAAIALKVDIPSLIDRFVFERREISYVGFSDILAAKALDDQRVYNRCVAGLKALLIVPWVYPGSQRAIEQTIQALELGTADIASLVEQRRKVTDNSTFREQLGIVFSSIT